MTKLCFILLAFFSSSLIAKEKGILFDLSNFLMKFSGHDYNLLEKEKKILKRDNENLLKENKTLKKNINGYQHELSITSNKQETDSQDLKFCIIERDVALQNASILKINHLKSNKLSNKLNKSNYYTGFNLLDIFASGCSGEIKYKEFGVQEDFRTKEKKPFEFRKDGNIITRLNLRKGMSSLSFLNANKSIYNNRSNRYLTGSDYRLYLKDYYKDEQFPAITLGEPYKNSFKRKGGGTLISASYDIEYIAKLDSRNYINVDLKAKSTVESSMRSSLTKREFSIKVVCQTLDKMNELYKERIKNK